MTVMFVLPVLLLVCFTPLLAVVLVALSAIEATTTAVLVREKEVRR
jgi:hypothetical protein